MLVAVALSLGSNRHRASAEGALIVLSGVAIDRVIGKMPEHRAEPIARVEEPREPFATVPEQ